MLKISKILILVLVIGGLFSFSLLNWASPGLAQSNLPLKVKQLTPKTDLPAFAADQIIVKFKRGLPLSAIEELKAKHGATEIKASKFGGFVTLRLPEGSDVIEKAKIFSSNPLIEYAHPDFFIQTSFVPNDTLYNYQWHFDDDHTNNPGGATSNPFGGANGGGIGMEQVWDVTTGTSSVTVAVLDTGAAYERFSDPNPAGCYNTMTGQLRKCPGPAINEYYPAPDLASTTFSILSGSDLVNSDDHPNDDESHGTHVVGTVAQSTNNSLGVAGVAFNTTIMPIKVLDANGNGLSSVVADGIYLAANNGADIISMSLGGPSPSITIENAVQYAFNNGVTVVAACGNSSTSSCDYPAAYDPYVIAVGATQYDETRAPYSSYGTGLDIVAPGGNTSVDQNEDGFADGVLQQTFGPNADTSNFAYYFFQGTSMATPHVAGTAALLLAKSPTLTPSQARNILESTAEDLGSAGYDSTFGWGLIDARAALASLTPAVSITLTTDGATPFGILPLGSVQDTTPAGLNDVQTVRIDTGPANLNVKTTVFSDGAGNSWFLGSTNGPNQVKWEFGTSTAGNWNTFLTPAALSGLAQGLTAGSAQNLYLRLTLPTTASATANQYSASVTIVATAP